MKLIIGYRESGTGKQFFVPFLSKRLGYFKTVVRELGIGNRKLVPCSLYRYIIPMYLKCNSGIRNQFPDHFNYNLVFTSFWLCLFHQQVWHSMILKS